MGVAAPFTDNVVWVSLWGPVYGWQAVEKWYADVFPKLAHSSHVTNGDEKSPPVVSADGKEAWWVGEWTTTLQTPNGPKDIQGYWSAVYVREGDAWKIRMLTWNETPPREATRH